MGSKPQRDSLCTLSSWLKMDSCLVTSLVSGSHGTPKPSTIWKTHMVRNGPTGTGRSSSTLATLPSSSPLSSCDGRSHHLQDQHELCLPAGNEELLLELRPDLRDHPGRLPVLLPWHGQGSEDVPAQVPVVAACPPLLSPHLLLR